jgi:hypothetical protein
MVPLKSVNVEQALSPTAVRPAGGMASGDAGGATQLHPASAQAWLLWQRFVHEHIECMGEQPGSCNPWRNDCR